MPQSPLENYSGSKRMVLDAGGKPSTWFPPGELVEQYTKPKISTSLVFAQIYFAENTISHPTLPRHDAGAMRHAVATPAFETLMRAAGN